MPNIFLMKYPPILVQFWCKKHAHTGNYARNALSNELISPKNELYAHNALYAHYVQ
jgi:hypothetical protein